MKIFFLDSLKLIAAISIVIGLILLIFLLKYYLLKPQLPEIMVNAPEDCPSGTELLFNKKTDNIKVGDNTALGGIVNFVVGDWSIETRNGLLLAYIGKQITVNFPQSTILDTVFIYDNDPKADERPWSINGIKLPITGQNEWGPPFKLNLTSTQMIFDYGGDSPHFNICVRLPLTPTPTSTPTSKPTPTPTVTISPTPTLTPTSTPSPSPTPTSTPTPTPTPSPTPSSTPSNDFSCLDLQPEHPIVTRPSSITYTCIGEGESAVFAEFRLSRNNEIIQSSGKLPLNANKRANWTINIDPAFDPSGGFYVIQCRICPNVGDCTAWGN